MLSGAFWINKPAELTSSDVVVRLKIALTRAGYCEKGFKIGHGGTLDPFATGAMIVLVGEATKLADAYLHSTKSYSGIITLGSRTDTADFTGTKVESSLVPSLTTDDWQKLADSFVNADYWQTPPMYSAKKQQGRPLHELARQGIEVERKAILKRIESFEVVALPVLSDGSAELSFVVRCEGGTYVRVIAEDLAKKAGTLAHLRTLVRIQTSDVDLEKCSDLEAVQAKLAEQLPIEQIAAFHSLKEVASHLPSVEISADEAQEVLQGYKNTVQKLIAHVKSLTSGAREAAQHEVPSPKYFIARLPDRSPVALFERTESGYRLQRVILWLVHIKSLLKLT